MVRIQTGPVPEVFKKTNERSSRRSCKYKFKYSEETSESIFYRVLREGKMQHHRGRSQKPTRRIPESHLATSPNQVWTWDITWLGKVVGWEIWGKEE
jgi:hypothetical protein